MTLTARHRDALEVIASFWTGLGGVTARDVADELHIQPMVARNMRSTLAGMGLVYGDGLVATGRARSDIRWRASDDRAGPRAVAMWRVLQQVERENEHRSRAPSCRDIQRALGLTEYQVAYAVAGLRSRRALLERGQWAPTAAGVIVAKAARGAA